MKIADKHVRITALAMFFIVSFLYFYRFGDYVFFYQENITLFLYSAQYLHPFLLKPGGLLEYAGSFLSQGYYNTLYGSLILSAILSLILWISLRIHQRLSQERPIALFLVMVPSCLLLLLHINFNWFMWNNLGYLLVLLYFLLTIARENRTYRLVLLTLFPAFYYLAGAFAWIFLGMYIVYSLLFDKRKARLVYQGYLLVVSFISFLLFKNLVFLQPLDVLLLFPFSQRDPLIHPWIFYVLTGFIIAYPVLFSLLSRIRIKNQPARRISLLALLVVLITGIFFQYKLFNPRIAKLFQLEKYVYQQNWNAVIEHQETWRLPNVVAQYYYNLALAQEGQLCDRMFRGPQDFGSNALIIAWDGNMGINNIARGIYFYYAAGLINEAHRWAYESMVVQGYRPETLKILVKTDLINGHFKMAEKYLNILKRSLHYKSWADEYTALLYRPDLVESHPELGKRARMMPKKDFAIQVRNPDTNLPLLLEGNPDNKTAYEYMMASHMLRKDIDAVISDLGKMKEMSYSKIPLHIEEVLILFTIGMNMMPDLGELKISEESVKRFRHYEIFADPALAISLPGKGGTQKSDRDTFWYYFDSK